MHEEIGIGNEEHPGETNEEYGGYNPYESEYEEESEEIIIEVDEPIAPLDSEEENQTSYNNSMTVVTGNIDNEHGPQNHAINLGALSTPPPSST